MQLEYKKHLFVRMYNFIYFLIIKNIKNIKLNSKINAKITFY